MNAQREETTVPRTVILADGAPGSRQAATPGTGVRDSGELLDDDLEYVVGGLARVWTDGATITHEERRPHGV